MIEFYLIPQPDVKFAAILKPLFFSRLNASRDTPRMLTRDNVGVRWRPFLFDFTQKTKLEKYV
jgi:hypothetical protein